MDGSKQGQRWALQGRTTCMAWTMPYRYALYALCSCVWLPHPKPGPCSTDTAGCQPCTQGIYPKPKAILKRAYGTRPCIGGHIGV